MTPLEQYKDVTRRVRENRRKPDTAATQAVDTALTEEWEVLWDKLSDAERAEIECLSWMAWPDQYDKRVEHERTVGGMYPRDSR